MELRQLGQSQLKISPIIFGAWAIGGWLWGGNDENDSIAAIKASLDQGVTTIDTAPMYGMGRSEIIVGKAIKGRRQNVIIATKCGCRWDTKEGSDPWERLDESGNKVVVMTNGKPQSIIEECEQSLKRLETDFIDLYQIHWPDTSTPIEESWNAMVSLKKQGKVRAIGVSNYSLEQLKIAHAIYPVDSLQPPFSLLRRDIEEDLLPYCRENHISILAYSPLERGLLTGKITLDRKFAKGDHRADLDLFSVENRKRVLEALNNIKPIADKHHATISQVILNCTIHVPGITAAIVGARNVAQAKENASAVDFELSQAEREMVSEILQISHMHGLS